MKKLLFICTLFFTVSNTVKSANYYWVGTTGNWSDLAHLSTTSGGARGTFTVILSSVDNVYFDANSFYSAAQTASVNPLTVYCNNMTWTGVTNELFITPK